MKVSASVYCDLITAVAQERKYEACETNNGVTDTDAFVSVAYADEVMGVNSMGAGNPVELLPTTLDLVLRKGVVKFDAVAFTAEVFMRQLENLTDEEREKVQREYKRGDLEKEYKENPITDIVEGLFTVVVTWEGDTAFRFVEVKYDDRGRPVYGGAGSETTDSQRSLSGFCRDILEGYRKYCRDFLETGEGRDYGVAFDELVESEGSFMKAVMRIEEWGNGSSETEGRQ